MILAGIFWEGRPAIEETIAPAVNVTLLFSCEQYEAAADACLRGLERRLSAELSVHSVASLFVSRWDKATMDKVLLTPSLDCDGSP